MAWIAIGSLGNDLGWFNGNFCLGDGGFATRDGPMFRAKCQCEFSLIIFTNATRLVRNETVTPPKRPFFQNMEVFHRVSIDKRGRKKKKKEKEKKKKMLEN